MIEPFLNITESRTCAKNTVEYIISRDYVQNELLKSFNDELFHFIASFNKDSYRKSVNETG